MARKKDNKVLSVMHPICCGIDVHKEVAVACILIQQASGEPKKVIKEFSTFTDSLFKLKEWLLSYNCPIVAMESTGIYWRSLHNVLEDSLEIVLVNARHMKNVPGRKTDVSDSQWIAELLRHGLLKGSFIPPQDVRQWRDLCRLKKKHIGTLSDYKKRVHKLFESANIKIDSVVSDLFGVTGRNLIQLLSTGEEIDFESVAACTRGKLKSKVNELFRSIKGFFNDHHRFMLSSIMKTIFHLEQEIDLIHKQLQSLLSDHQEIIDRLMEIPGIKENAAFAIVAEIGINLDEFSNTAAICSWAGVCPGNNQSAGKRRSGKSSVRGQPLKCILVESAWAAVKKKGSFYREKFQRLRVRRGAKKAIVAIAHKILKAVFYIIKEGQRYKELGESYFQQQKGKRLPKLIRQIEKLGMKVTPA